MSEDRYCEWRTLDGELCGRDTDATHRYCAAHRQRAAHGRDMDKPIAEPMTTREWIIDRAIKLANYDDEDDEGFAESVRYFEDKCRQKFGKMSDEDKALLEQAKTRREHLKSIAKLGGQARMRRMSEAELSLHQSTAGKARWHREDK